MAKIAFGAWRHRWFLFLTALVLSLVAMAYTHHVSGAVTADDRVYIARILEENGYGDLLTAPPATSYEEEIAVVRAVQDAVLKASPDRAGIPLGVPREPRNLYEYRRGLCFDRSRAIEKILTHLGFETRHVSLFSTAGSGTVKALVTPGIPSHALSEVRTRKGWLVVDSNFRWIGLERDGSPLSVAALQALGPERARRTVPGIAGSEPFLQQEPFTYVYGLYSRHGRFYAPMNPIPDVNFVELMDNF